MIEIFFKNQEVKGNLHIGMPASIADMQDTHHRTSLIHRYNEGLSVATQGKKVCYFQDRKVKRCNPCF